jgi:DNA-directed RNA polymerase sigma subunit (sigma70/sigma32)
LKDNQRAVYKIAKQTYDMAKKNKNNRYFSTDLALSDFIQEGNKGLMRAI